MDANRSESPGNSTVVAILCAIVFVIPLAWIGIHFATRFDFIYYWISAHLLAHGHNPYDRAAIWQIEDALGNHEAVPFIMRNPPWVLPFVAPLGYLGIRSGALLWFVCLLLLAVLSVWFLTRDHPAVRPRAAFFVPLLLSLMLGQLTAMVLFASAFFLAFWKKRPFLSGFVLSLAALKAHLLALFWPVLLLDCYRRRDWRIPSGLLLGVVLLSGLAFLFDPHAWAQYGYAMLQESIGHQYLPNISADLRFLLLPRRPWFQLVPSILGIVVALWYYARGPWDWMEQGAVLLAVSALLSPYSWSYDMALMLPAVLRVRAGRRQQDLFFLCCLLSFLCILTVFACSWNTPWLSLLGPVWMGWYLAARYLSQPSPSSAPLEPSRSQ